MIGSPARSLRTTSPQNLARMSLSTTSSSSPLSTEVVGTATAQAQMTSSTVAAGGLTNASSVARYLKRTPFAAREVQRIQLGSTNFTYRLFLEKPYGQNAVRTAILKYAASHTADDSAVEFSADRQIYEARAMTRIPWKLLMVPPPASSSSPLLPLFGAESNYSPERWRNITSAKLRVPELYMEDAMRHVIIMEDGTPRPGSDEVWQERSHSARIFFEEVPPSQQKYETAGFIGLLLGSFLARLHNWGSSQENRALALASFAGNDSAKDLTIRETFTDFFASVERTGFVVPEALRAELESRLNCLEELVRNNLETVVMGDFWPGNILLSFTEKAELDRLSVIDWEFTMLAPAFLDVGNFIGEVFLIHYFESNDAVYIVLLEAFMKAYHGLAQAIDPEKILAYAGAHIMLALPRRIESVKSRATRENSRPMVEQVLKFITDPKFTTQKSDGRDGGVTNDVFEGVLALMRERQTKT
ncbi:hypothetical protein AJ78_08201 [Emergomyces pasteurianus Ep9510]|uniref:Aminoglycoside phosphotransferase domain-containing protein n=1 Tax=Emergomyces pasteurianus Ep9510 TaxID=1447872 RepID=A0A1J9P2D2_9EURO|nr:hypothetical protein AJ78_08201 [Emergomyces pasteurianus Ep9510]